MLDFLVAQNYRSFFLFCRKAVRKAVDSFLGIAFVERINCLTREQDLIYKNLLSLAQNDLTVGAGTIKMFLNVLLFEN